MLESHFLVVHIYLFTFVPVKVPFCLVILLSFPPQLLHVLATAFGMCRPRHRVCVVLLLLYFNVFCCRMNEL